MVVHLKQRWLSIFLLLRTHFFPEIYLAWWLGFSFEIVSYNVWVIVEKRTSEIRKLKFESIVRWILYPCYFLVKKQMNVNYLPRWHVWVCWLLFFKRFHVWPRKIKLKRTSVQKLIEVDLNYYCAILCLK